MPDVHLIWYTLEPDSRRPSPTPLTRATVQAWAKDLALPMGPLSKRSRGNSFTRACKATSTTYTDARQVTHTIRGRLDASKDDFIAFHAVRGDGQRLAQIKYFHPRRTETGLVAGSHRVTTKLRPDLDDLDTVATRGWLHAVQTAFDAAQGNVSAAVMHRLARACFLQVATPVRRRKSTYFCYEDQLPAVRATAALLHRCDPDADVGVFAAADGADLSDLAISADDWAITAILKLTGMIETWVEHPPGTRARLDMVLKTWRALAAAAHRVVDSHEAHLLAPLPRCRAGLAQAEEMIAAMDPTVTC